MKEFVMKTLVQAMGARAFLESELAKMAKGERKDFTCHSWIADRESITAWTVPYGRKTGKTFRTATHGHGNIVTVTRVE